MQKPSGYLQAVFYFFILQFKACRLIGCFYVVPMKKYLLCFSLLLSSAALYAQDAAPAATPDTASYRVNRFVMYSPGKLRLADGTEVSGYMPVTTVYPGIDFPFVYYLSHPDRKPKPKKQNVQIQDIVSMTAGAHYYEAMRVPTEKKVRILAERFVNGPVELFLQAEPESVPLPIPVAGAILNAAIPYKNSHFFVRRDGKLTEVNRSVFQMQISQYLSDYPELAVKVARGEKEYHYRNMVGIITEYNRHMAAAPVSGGN